MNQNRIVPVVDRNLDTGPDFKPWRTGSKGRNPKVYYLVLIKKTEERDEKNERTN